MPRFGQRTFASTVVLSLCALVFAGIGPTLPPQPWDGVAPHSTVSKIGPTLPPQPWDGVVPSSTVGKIGPTLPPQPWDGIV